MNNKNNNAKGLNIFEKYLPFWVILCIVGGIILGKFAPDFAVYLDSLAIKVNNAPVISVPIAVCLFFMMYPIMVKINFAEVLQAGKSIKPVGLTLIINWAIKPFTMYAISIFFLGTVFYGFIGPEAVDHIKMPFGLDLPVGATYGDGTVIIAEGVKMLEVPLWRSYLAGCILLGIAPCTAMVLVWGSLAKGNDGHTLVMVAINSLAMLFLYGPLGGLLLGIGRLPVPWQALLLSIAIYVALPLVAGYLSRKWIIAAKGEKWFKENFLHILTPVTIMKTKTQFKPYQPNQLLLLPPDMKQWLPEDDLAYFIMDVVNGLDLSSIYQSYDSSRGGQPPFDPKMMTALLLYAYCVGISSSRKIEKAT